MVAGVAGHEGQAMHERERTVGGVQVGEQVGHGNEHGEPGAPAFAAVARAEVDTDADDLVGADARFEQPEDGLGRHQRQSLLEAVERGGRAGARSGRIRCR